jgi:membrane peptidoglycan carboxypeptidase
VSSSWFVGYTPKLATAVMYNRGVGNQDLEGYLLPFYGGTFPAMTFKAYMDAAINPASCGEFILPGNIKATKGQTYSTPAPQKKKKDSGGSGNGSNSGNNNNGSNTNGNGTSTDGTGTSTDGTGTSTEGGGTDGAGTSTGGAGTDGGAAGGGHGIFG